ncbi:MAG: ATP-binding protein [Patescibacteria group bacterium]|nr:ATP-binding protein [Patescibacteria group bacterium]
MVISNIEIFSWGSNIIGGPLYLFYNIWTVIGFLFAVFLIILRVKSAKSNERAQIFYFISGAAIFTFTGIILGVIYPAITGSYSYAKFASYGIIFLFVFTAYAIVTHHLFDIRIIIKRTLVYSGLLLFILGIYGSIVFIIAQLFGQETFGKGLFSNIAAAIFIAVGFGPVKAWLSEITDKWLFKGEYNPEEVIKHVASHLSSVVDLDEALTTMMHETARALRVKLAATFVLRKIEDKIELKRTKSIGYSPNSHILEMTPDDPLIEFFTLQMIQKNDGHIVVIDDLKKALSGKYSHNKQLLEQVINRLNELKSFCAIPLRIKNELIGIFVLGEKLSGDDFNETDLRFLETVSHQTVSAIEKARFYEEDRLKTEFVNIASHELLTPISAIKGYLSMILEEGMGKVDKQARGYLEKVYHSSLHLSELVQDLLNVSRIEQNRIKIEPKEMNIIEMIKQVIQELMPKVKEKKLSLNFNRISSKILKNKQNVFADPERVHQILVNLLGNSIKYSEKGVVEVKLGTCTNKNNKQILVEVIDSGIGIPKNDLKKLFNKFFRASNATASSAEGSGLGLYITKSFVELMGGSIWVNSKEGKGSIFSFSLPLKPV